MGPGSEIGSHSPGGSYLEMGGVCLALVYGAHTRACERLGRVGRDTCRLNLVVVVELVERDARLAREIYQRHGKEPESDDKEQSNRVLMPHVIECAHECHYHQHRRYDCAHCGEQYGAVQKHGAAFQAGNVRLKVRLGCVIVFNRVNACDLSMMRFIREINTEVNAATAPSRNAGAVTWPIT